MVCARWSTCVPVVLAWSQGHYLQLLSSFFAPSCALKHRSPVPYLHHPGEEATKEDEGPWPDKAVEEEKEAGAGPGEEDEEEDEQDREALEDDMEAAAAGLFF